MHTDENCHSGAMETRSSTNKMAHADPGGGRCQVVSACACVVQTKQKQSAAMFKGKPSTSRVFPLSDVRQMDVSSAPDQAASGRWSLASKLMKHLLAKVTTLNLNDFLR